MGWKGGGDCCGGCGWVMFDLAVGMFVEEKCEEIWVYKYFEIFSASFELYRCFGVSPRVQWDLVKQVTRQETCLHLYLEHPRRPTPYL